MQLALVNYSKANAVYTKQFDSDFLAPVAEAMYFNAIPILSHNNTTFISTVKPE